MANIFLIASTAHAIVKVLASISPQQFCGIVSDNTGNTRLARALVTEDFPWIINMLDAPHHIQLMLKDIGNLPYFKLVSLGLCFKSSTRVINTAPIRPLNVAVQW
jgi:hypothetical protein